MNILFLTLVQINSINERDIYTDLMRNLVEKGHRVCIVTPYERRVGLPTQLESDGNCHILHVRIGNTQKTNIIEKGISTVLLEFQYKRAIAKYLGDVKFDLVLYSTPPITLTSVVSWIKNRDGAASYLMLKDIFPQNAIDLGMLSETGLKGLIYRFFRAKEKKLYALSDRIGCMSQANIDYVIKHNPEVDPRIVEHFPNCVEIQDLRMDKAARLEMRQKYDIPQDKTVFVYGGNLGRPQGIRFLIECLKTQANNPDAFFLIVGSGTEYDSLTDYFSSFKPANMRLMAGMPKDDYDRMIAACDVGMIFLDHRFTIPNFPSRLLSYMQAGLPVIACTDPNTDIGKIIVDGGFGWWCESSSASAFSDIVSEAIESNLAARGNAGFDYAKANYSVEHYGSILG